MPIKLTDSQKELIKDSLARIIVFSKDTVIFKQQIHALQDAILRQQISKDMEEFVTPFLDIFKNPNLITDLDKYHAANEGVITFSQIREYLLTAINKLITKNLEKLAISDYHVDLSMIANFVRTLPDNTAIYFQRISAFDIYCIYNTIRQDCEHSLSRYLQLLPWFSPEVQAVKKQQLIEFVRQGQANMQPAILANEYYTVQQLQTHGDLIARSISLLCRFTEVDYFSVVQGTPETANISELRRLLLELETKGFCGIPAEMKFAFWSGQFAKDAAIGLVFPRTNGACTDVNIPTFSFLFSLVKILNKLSKGPEDPNVIFTLCATLASHATGIVDVYVSSDKNSERTGIKCGNYFWNVELPVLQRLKETGRVTKIMLNRYNEELKTWLPPIDLNSPQINKLPLYRQLPYKSKEKSAQYLNDDSTLFDENDYYMSKFNCLTVDAFDRWKKDCPPRPYITIGKVKQMATIWKENARRKAIMHK